MHFSQIKIILCCGKFLFFIFSGLLHTAQGKHFIKFLGDYRLETKQSTAVFLYFNVTINWGAYDHVFPITQLYR